MSRMWRLLDRANYVTDFFKIGASCLTDIYEDRLVPINPLSKNEKLHLPLVLPLAFLMSKVTYHQNPINQLFNTYHQYPINLLTY